MLTVSCPHCTVTMQLPDDLVGKEVECRACTRSFFARADGALATSESGDTVQAKHWQCVRRGLTLIMVCTVLALAVAPLAWIRLTLLLEAIRGQASARAPLVVLTLVIAAAALVIAVLQVAGAALCRAAPHRHGAARLAEVVQLLTVAAILLVLYAGYQEGLSVGTRFHPIIRCAAAGKDSIGDLAVVANVVATIVFLFYLRAIALTLPEPELARSVRNLLILVGVTLALIGGLFAAMVAVTGGIASDRPPPEAMMGAGGCLMFVSGLVFLIWYFILLTRFRAALVAKS